MIAMSDRGNTRLIRPTPISGFPEWLPEARHIEVQWLDEIRRSFESYGFCNIETPAVESLDALMSKGETSQEVYALHRVQADPDDRSDARIGLHFDLTVPFARYVAQNFNDLDFPFKRYQIQKVWRGERPQEGRYREFTQCDIDVIGVDAVPLHFDAEMPRIAHEILTRLGVGPFSININNRKVLEGFYRALGIADPVAVLRIVDKLDKLGSDGVLDLLHRKALLSGEQADAVIELARIRGTDAGVVKQIRQLGAHSDLLEQGLEELGLVMDHLSDLPVGSVVADLSIARGLDYYTGTVYEGKFLTYPEYGSICSGGRYENLASAFTKYKLPGVGISIGLTRVFAKLLSEGVVEPGPKCPSDLLVVVPSGDLHRSALEVAAQLRARGYNVETYHQADKISKQLRYAARKGIPFVWFPPFQPGHNHEVKDMASGEQLVADPALWTRPRQT